MINIDDAINKYFIEDARTTLKERIPDESLDLVSCSPPYDDLRNYKGMVKKDKKNIYSFPFEEIAQLLTQKLTKGGVIVWVVGDATHKGSETGTSFRQALYFKDVCGLNIHDTMIYEKNTSSFPAKRTGKRYTQIFEYMFVFSKGIPKTVNLISDKPNKWAGWTNWGKKTHRGKNDDLVETNDIKPVPKFSPRNNIWKYVVGKGHIAKDKVAHEHPAIFPDALAYDHIITWTNEGDIVYDPFTGSGTTLKMSKILNRKFIGSELVESYEPIIKERLSSPIFANKRIEQK